MEMSKGRRNFLVTLLSFMVGMIYFIPYIRISFYDQTVVALQLTNAQMGVLGSVYGTLAIFCYGIGGILAQKYSPRLLMPSLWLVQALFLCGRLPIRPIPS